MGDPEEGEEEMMYTLREAEPLLGLKRARLMQLIGAGELRADQKWTDKGPRRVIAQSEIDRFLRDRAQDSATRTGPGVRPRIGPGRQAAESGEGQGGD